MNRSLNEIGLLCRRAARGGRIDWGLADDAARGARWSSSFGLPGVGVLVARLEALDGQDMADRSPGVATSRWSAAAGELCPLAAGAALSDRAALLTPPGSITLSDVLFPLLVVPFAHDAATLLGTPVRVAWGDVALTMDGRGLHVAGDPAHLGSERCERLHCGGVATMPGPVASPGFRGHVDDDVWHRLSEFALRTLAPATEESRLRGAGGADDG